MIVKYIANPKAQSSKASRIGSLLDYIEADGRADAQKAEYIGADGNFYSDSQQGQRAEMVALAMEATRSKDPVDHWLLSWKEGEQPTQAQCNEAVEILKRYLGMNESHLAVFALHRNTENYHLHVVLNRVNPVTMRVEDKGWCIDKAHKAIAELSTRRAGKQRKTLAMSPTAAVRSHDPAVRASFSPARRRGTMRMQPERNLANELRRKRPRQFCSMRSRGRRCMRDWPRLICAMSGKAVVQFYGWVTSRSRPLASDVNSAEVGWKSCSVNSKLILAPIQRHGSSARRSHFARICRRTGLSIEWHSKRAASKRTLPRSSSAWIIVQRVKCSLRSFAKSGPHYTRAASGPGML